MHNEIASYLDHLASKKRATNATLKNYHSTLSRFDKWLGERAFDQFAISDYVATIKHAASANVIQTRLVGLAKFLDLNVNKVERIKEPQKTPDALTATEVDALINAARQQSKELAAIVIFLSETGLRFQEFLDFRLEHVRSFQTKVSASDGIKTSQTARWVEVTGKGRKTRRVPLSPSAFEAAQLLPVGMSQYQQNKLRADLAKAGKDAGIDIHIHPHLLRATFMSIKLNEEDHEAIHIAMIVGHQSVDTMRKHYAAISMDKLYEVVAAA
jgi:integrase